MVTLTIMTGIQLKDIMRHERSKLQREFGVIRLISAKEMQGEVTFIAEIANPLPTKCNKIAKYLEGILGGKVKVIAKGNTQLEPGVNTKKANR